MFSNMPIMLSRFTPGVAAAEAEVQNIFQGYMEGTTTAAGGQVGTGSGFDSRNTGNNYTIDGATNNGFGRRIASSPNSDQIEEMRVETSNFDASQGYGTGLTVSMMTRGGTNTLRGTANYTHWNNEVNSPNLQQKVAVQAGPAGGRRVALGPLAHRRLHARRTDRHSESDRRPPQGVLLRQLLEVGRLGDRADSPATPPFQPTAKHLEGDFSDLLLLPSGPGATTPAGHHQYQIFDPLTTRPDPLRPGRVIRDPFPEQHHPERPVHERERLATRIRCSGSTRRWCRGRTRTSSRRRSSRSTTTIARRSPTSRTTPSVSARVDYNLTNNDRIFIRGNGNTFLESSLVDWTYDSPDPQFIGLHDVARATIHLVGDRHVDRRAWQHRLRYAGRGQPGQSTRHAQEPHHLHAEAGRAPVLPGRLLSGALRVHHAVQSTSTPTRISAARSTAASGSRTTRASRT